MMLHSGSSSGGFDTKLPVALPLARGGVLHDAVEMPFAAGRHADTDGIQKENLSWLSAHGLLGPRNRRTFERAQFHDLAGRVYHHADREGLRLAADFIAALFVLDDLMDGSKHALARDPKEARRAMEVVRLAACTGTVCEGHAPEIESIASAVADLTRRLSRRGAPLAPYLRELETYLDGVVEETRRRQTSFSDVADYADVRVSFSAVYACVELGMALEGTALRPELRPLARAANLSVSWVNDLFSWPKERVLGEGSNLIPVMSASRGLDEAQAFAAACRACDDVVYEYLGLRERLAPPRSETALLEQWIRGNYDWHAVGTARYVEHLSVAPSTQSRRDRVAA